MTRYADDDEIVAPQSVSGGPSTIAGKTKLTIKHNEEAPLVPTNYKVLLELTGTADVTHRPAVDLVAVLDVSEKMAGEKLTRLKIAMQFLIRKLGDSDRLSIVTFSDNAKRLCRLIQIKEDSVAATEQLVNNLTASGKTNIVDGLQVAKQVIRDRKFTDKRVAAIMLMSDGRDDVSRLGSNIHKVPTTDVPVHTFGFGKDQDSKVLNEIVRKSRRGTFSNVQREENLSEAFSQCLAGLLTTVVEDLVVTVIPLKSTVKSILVGNYEVSKDPVDASETVSFGNLYSKEVRKIVVNLRLPEFPKRTNSNIIEVKYSYICAGKEFDADSITVPITRTKKAKVNQEVEDEIQIEDDREYILQVIKQAVDKAERNELEEARDMLDEAQNRLHDAFYERNNLIETLKYELKLLLGYMRSPEIYEKEGRGFAFACLNSHGSQRFTSRGDLDKLRAYATPRMDAYKGQAQLFDKDPSKPPQSEAEDLMQELAADPFAPVVAVVGYHQMAAIRALIEGNNILENVTKAQDLENLLATVEKAIRSVVQMQVQARGFLLEHLNI